MTCESCGDKPKKCDKDFTKAVIEIDNPERITLMRRVVIPASMGDDTTVPPTVGKYKNVLLFYEANTKSYLYSSDGIPTQLVNGVTDYEAAVNLPKINGVTLLGNQSSADLKLANAPIIISLDSGQWSSDKTIGQIFDAFNAGTAIMLDFGNAGAEGTKAWPVVQLGYNAEDNMLLGVVAYAQTENASDFTGEGGYGTFILHDDHSAEINNIDWQRKMTVTDDTGLSWDGETLSGIPATDATIGMIKPGDGLSVDANGELGVNAGDGLSVDSDNVLNANIGEGLKLDADNSIYVIKHVFDTVADMKASTDLVNGDYARTLGFHTINDGGGTTYKITDTGTANEMDVIAVGSLYANLVKEKTNNVKQFGAYGDDTHDDSSSINRSLAAINYAYIPEGTYKIDNTIVVGGHQKLYGSDYLNTTLHYTGSTMAITEDDTDSVNTINISIHDLTVTGTNKTGSGLYMWRSQKSMPTPGDSFSNIYNIRVSNFETGLYIGQYQNVSKYTNITAEENDTGILFDHANDIDINTVVSYKNAKDGVKVLSSSVISICNVHAFYNGSLDDTQYYNFNFDSSSAINIANLVAQESYGDNIKLNYTNNLTISSCFLSWPGLTKTTDLRQIHMVGCNNVKINGASQNGQYGVAGYNNYILGLQNSVQNCTIKLTAESDFPASQKINNISGTQSFNVYNGNIFEIEKPNALKYAKVNYLKNGTLENKTDLTAVSNSTFCSWNNGLLRVDMTGQTYARDVYWKIAELPRADVYTTYLHFKSVSGTGIVSFNHPGAVSITNIGDEYWISFTKYMSSTSEDQTITLQVGKEIVIDVIEAGICLGESGMFNLPLSEKAKVS